MSRWIDADRLTRKLNDAIWLGEMVDRPTGELEAVLDDVLSAPTIDIVRCGECKWWWKEWETCTHNNLVDGHNCATTFKADSFCSYGERRER